MADPPNKLNVPVNNDYALSVEKSLELPTVMDEGVFRSYLNNSNILIRPNADSNAFMQMARAAGSNAGSGAGSFLREVAKQSGLIGSLAAKAHRVLPDPNPVGQESAVDEATYEATEMALNAAYNTVVKSFEAEFHRLGFESLIPMAMPLHQKRQLFQWSRDESPPHLELNPRGILQKLVAGTSFVLDFISIFSLPRLVNTASLISRVVPAKVLDAVSGSPCRGHTMAQLFDNNHRLLEAGRGVYAFENVGERIDWFSDAVFCNQFFVGVNPCTLEVASPALMKHFVDAATAQAHKVAAAEDILAILTGAAPDAVAEDTFYVQDCSGFRAAAKMPANAPIHEGERYGVAPVTLFRLTSEGTLHVLGICIDWKEDPAQRAAVTLFNKRARATDDKSGEATDWPWRYAKTCAMSADWTMHEISVHLTRTHYVEEATIVGAQRSFPEDHAIYKLLSPHWLKTLPLNAAARLTLVPSVISPLSAFKKDELTDFIRHSYATFDFKAMYAPNDLNRRGFPVNQLDQQKFRNYGYGRDIIAFWTVLRRFVEAALHGAYPDDEALRADEALKTWTREMQDPAGGAMPTFPEFKTFDDLVDCVTACLHIATAQHTAINYSQLYYNCFPPSRPPALFEPPPQTMSELHRINEKKLVNSLPANRPRDWLLAVQVSYLISKAVNPNETLLAYAQSAARMPIRLGPEAENDKRLSMAAKQLSDDLDDLANHFKVISQGLDDQETVLESKHAYSILFPSRTAVSILL